MGFHYSPKIVTDGLVLYLDAANPKSIVSGSTIWNDMSRGGNNGTLINSLGFNSGNGGSIVFDGVDDYATIPYIIQNNFTNKISVSMWINAEWFNTSANDGVNLIGKAKPSPVFPYTIWSLSLAPTGQYGGSVGDGNTRTTLTSASTILLNTWYNLVLTYDGTTIKLYKNGIQDINTATGTYTLGQNTTDPVIGGWQTLGNYYDWFKGRMTQIQLYNRALSAAEILQNYNTTKSRFGL